MMADVRDVAQYVLARRRQPVFPIWFPHLSCRPSGGDVSCFAGRVQHCFPFYSNKSPSDLTPYRKPFAR